MSYKASKELQEQTIQLMEEELLKKSNNTNTSKKLMLTSLSIAMLALMIINQNQSQTETITQLQTSSYEFHSENTSNELVTIYQDEYEMHLAKIKEYNPDYTGVIFGDDYYILSQAEMDEMNRSAAKREYEYIIEIEVRINDRLLNTEQKALLQEKFNSMELTNPLKEWKYVSCGYIEEQYDYYGVTMVHHAYDLATDKGTPIYAIADGVVTNAGEYTGSYGLLVEIDHGDGLISRYAHCNFMENKLVKDGDIVKAGQQIAEVGQTGNSTGPHLHFETRYKHNTFDIRLFDFNDESLFKFE